MARHHRFGFKFLHPPSVERDASQMSMVHASDSIKMSKCARTDLQLLAEETETTQVPYSHLWLLLHCIPCCSRLHLESCRLRL